MSKFGVNIDLSIFFEDERKKVLIMVDPKWESVECLQKRVQYLFEVDTVRFINSDGSFLPPQEPIEIIKFCKGLKAFVPKEYLEKRKKSKKNKKEKSLQETEETPNSICIKESNNDESQKKRKYISMGSGVSASSTPNQAKRIKSISKFNQTNKSSQISSTVGDMPPPPSTTTTSSPAVTSVTLDYERASVEKISNQSELKWQEYNTKIDANTCNIVNNKNQHTCTQKEKETSENVQNEEITFDDEFKARPSNAPSSTFINESKMIPNQKSIKSLQSPNNKNPFKRQTSNNSKGHVYFNESGEMVSTISSSKNTTKNDKENKEPKAITIFRCSLNDVSSNDLQKPRIFTKRLVLKEPKRKQVVEIQEEIILRHKETERIWNTSQTSKTKEYQETDSSEMPTSQTLHNTITASLHTKDQEKCTIDDTTIAGSSSIVNNKNQMSTENLVTTKNATTIANTSNQTSMENLETTKTVEEDPVIQDDSVLNQTDTKNVVDQTSVLSVDSVDLSIVIDDEEEDDKKHKKQSKINSKEQSHDLTYDDQDDDSSDIEEISEIIDLNETEDNCDETVNTSSLNCSKIVIHKILPFCTDLLELPNTGDIIVFKVASTNKKKFAETNFIAGKTEYVNNRTRSIKILIVDGIIELPNIPSKFLCNLDESHDNIKHLQLKLNDMLEPKIFSRS